MSLVARVYWPRNRSRVSITADSQLNAIKQGFSMPCDQTCQGSIGTALATLMNWENCSCITKQPTNIPLSKIRPSATTPTSGPCRSYCLVIAHATAAAGMTGQTAGITTRFKYERQERPRRRLQYQGMYQPLSPT